MSNAVYERVTETLIAALKDGTAPWRKPWDPTVGLPRSLATGKPYRGINPLLLGIVSQLRGYGSPYWGTYRNISASGGQVRKGEHATMVTLWKQANRKVDDGAGGEKDKPFLLLRSYLVFNADQADGLETPTAPGMSDHDPIASAERVLQGYLTSDGAPGYVGSDKCWYECNTDTLGLPPMGAFDSAETFYGAAFHEAIHSTGHESRLARKEEGIGHRFGSPTYAREELVAEMGAAMLAGVAGIEMPLIENSAAYLRNWLGALEGDVKLAVSAAGAAQKAADFIIEAGTDDDEAEA